ncbi:hypothetical protein CANARDRAFT_193565 [[Candida] arabinofermentans NRRL YB-2248]|uniref:NAD-dependent protein deacetylase n=1 Tax=[Candida] arabinofermentans NRRL YB-2248 TaxID=983967 RepID=A0A1E4T8F1_9ASCO|nr:hypothetical protein CANARDRAFT_193565 [[Candida] arabinofermentans NRRL YB-2248]
MAIEKDLEKIASILKKDGSNITFFVGAGISTNCGIPDFRSPKTGLYANLARLNLPYPEAVFDIEYFRKDPKPFYMLADELFPGKFVPSKFHYFIRLCQEKKKLKRCYTQNIDTLERIAGVNDEFMVEAHGSFAASHCIDCKEEMATDVLKEQMKKGIPTCAKCKGYVKPDIVFFGEALPTKFFDLWDKDSGSKMALAFVAGTSLGVYPFASLPSEVSKNSTRVLVNKERCGDFKAKPRKQDIIILEDCDSIAHKIVKLLGWEKELEALMEQGKKDHEAYASAVDNKEELETVNDISTVEETSKRIASEVAKVEETSAALKDDDKDDSDLVGITEGLEHVKLKEP